MESLKQRFRLFAIGRVVNPIGSGGSRRLRVATHSEQANGPNVVKPLNPSGMPDVLSNSPVQQSQRRRQFTGVQQFHRSSAKLHRQNR